MIRLANINDIDDINRLGLLLNKKFLKVYNLEEMFKHDYNKIYLYIENEEVVGMLMAIVLYDTCEIENIVVKEEYRNKKIATNLIDTLISEFNENIKTLTLEVAVDNEKAINLYKKFGLEVINIRKKYYDGKDAYLMGVKYEGR